MILGAFSLHLPFSSTDTDPSRKASWCGSRRLFFSPPQILFLCLFLRVGAFSICATAIFVPFGNAYASFFEVEFFCWGVISFPVGDADLSVGRHLLAGVFSQKRALSGLFLWWPCCFFFFCPRGRRGCSFNGKEGPCPSS